MHHAHDVPVENIGIGGIPLLLYNPSAKREGFFISKKN